MNKAEIKEVSKNPLGKVVRLMKKYPNMEIAFGAHTDSRGTTDYNQWLSERRAERTVEYIISQGITSDRISHEAFGETQLVNECSDGVRCTEAQHAKNRRSDFEIVKY